MQKRSGDQRALSTLFRRSAEGTMGRRELLSKTVALAAGTLAGGAGGVSGRVEAQRHIGSTYDSPLVLSEQGQFWLGVEPVETEAGTIVNGEQMYVWYQFPAEVTKPYPIVLVHGGGGQGTDYLGTPFGGPGWATFLLQEGYRVYVVDRPGLGRASFYPQLLGEMGSPATYEQIMAAFTAMNRSENPHPHAHLHTQWAGSGEIGDPALDQFMAGIGASMRNSEQAFRVWRSRGEELLDRIGPSVMMTHSAGGPLGWLTADSRPELLKALVAVEPAGPLNVPLTYDPPASSPQDIETVMHTPAQADAGSYPLQAEPARQLVNLMKVPITVVLAEASNFNQISPGTVAYLRQAGCDVELLRLADHGVRGNGHFMMMERNNREALQPILTWLNATLGGDSA